MYRNCLSSPATHLFSTLIVLVQGDWNAKVGRDACRNWQGICGPLWKQIPPLSLFLSLSVSVCLSLSSPSLSLPLRAFAGVHLGVWVCVGVGGLVWVGG